MQISSLPGFKKKPFGLSESRVVTMGSVRFFYKIKSVQKCVSAWFSVQTSFRCKASSLKKERERGGGSDIWGSHAASCRADHCLSHTF